MRRRSWRFLIERLRTVAKIDFAPGLSGLEVLGIEARYGFRFPPDLRDFLQTALPRGRRFPDWRNGDEARFRAWFDLPREGVVFDVRQGFWLPEWGERPHDEREAIGQVEALIAAAPKLIPVYAHRMMPADPHLAGNPVFSVHQADIIHYGRDLEAYLNHEFLGADYGASCTDCRTIAFWDIPRFQEVRWAKNGAYRYGGLEENL